METKNEMSVNVFDLLQVCFASPVATQEPDLASNTLSHQPTGTQGNSRNHHRGKMGTKKSFPPLNRYDPFHISVLCHVIGDSGIWKIYCPHYNNKK